MLHEQREVLQRIFTGSRPHHVHASVGGHLVAFGLFGTNKAGIIDTHTDTLLGEWPASTNSAARSHAGAFSPDGRTVYVANDIVNELSAVDPLTGELLWTMTVLFADELIVTHNGKTAYVSGRAGNVLHVVDLERHEIVRTIPLGPMPDTLGLSANEKRLTVALRGTPAQVAIVDTETLEHDNVTIGERERSPATSGPHRTGTSRTQRSRAPARASRSSTTTGTTKSHRPSTIPAGRTGSTSPDPR